MSFELYTNRQHEVYRMLCRKNLPGFFQNLFGAAHPAIDFMVALHYFWLQSRSNQHWVVEKVTPLIRRQVKNATASQIRAMTQAASERVKDDDTRTQCLIPMFSLNPDDIEGAVLIFGRITDILLAPDFNDNTHYPTLQLLLMLIIMQERTYTWGSFIKGVKRGDPEAVSAFGKLFDFWAVNREIPTFQSVQELPRGLKTEKDTENSLCVAVPTECVEHCNLMYAIYAQTTLPDVSRLSDLVESFWQNRELFQSQADSMWHAVVVNARCDLRERGFDGLEIEIPALNEHGLADLQLIPHLNDRPHSTARFWYGAPVSKIHFYRDHEITSPRLGLDQANDARLPFNGKLTCLYRYLAIAGIWTICMGNLRLRKSAKKYSQPFPGQTARVQEVPSRVHFRQIEHLGWHASQYALNRCHDHYRGMRIPPAGKTFVKPEKATNRTGNGVTTEFSVVAGISQSVLAVVSSASSQVAS